MKKKSILSNTDIFIYDYMLHINQMDVIIESRN